MNLLTCICYFSNESDNRYRSQQDLQIVIILICEIVLCLVLWRKIQWWFFLLFFFAFFCEEEYRVKCCFVCNSPYFNTVDHVWKNEGAVQSLIIISLANVKFIFWRFLEIWPFLWVKAGMFSSGPIQEMDSRCGKLPIDKIIDLLLWTKRGGKNPF